MIFKYLYNNIFCSLNSRTILAIGILLISVSCLEEKKKSISPDENKFYNGIGVGPVSRLELSEGVNEMLADSGRVLFDAKCAVCHYTTKERKIGPGLEGITLRRRPEWILNQILNPLEMTEKDSLARELKLIYLSQMTDMNLSENDARNILEYFRLQDQ